MNVAGIDINKPTLFLSECVLIYIEAEESKELIQWVGNTFNTSVFVTYEQIRPDDSFGRIMIKNLQVVVVVVIVIVVKFYNLFVFYPLLVAAIFVST